ncbi:hypothetical protein XAP6164_2180006 [Xanthomonas phaseoli pv. phaseoli]|nr:hypothetical protein XAP6164_2180006 [Xanthomonas phaseoli pv. phaseoli]
MGCIDTTRFFALPLFHRQRTMCLDAVVAWRGASSEAWQQRLIRATKRNPIAVELPMALRAAAMWRDVLHATGAVRSRRWRGSSPARLRAH